VGAGLPNVPANAVAIDPLDPSRIFVGTDIGVYESSDGGESFVPFSAGLPLGLVVTDLEIDDSPHVLVAGTFGRGAFRVNLLAGANQPPRAAFTFAASLLSVTFTDQSSDADGTIASWLWNFGDGTTSAAASPTKTYAAGGTYTVSLTVTDNDGASGSTTRQVTVSSGGGCGGTTFTGSIGTQGGTQIQPNGTWYQSAAGTHVGCLNGPAGTDFDLYLDRWTGSAWAQVAASEGPTAVEKIIFQGTAGFYRWRIVAFSGTGAYTFALQRP
jgi:PKD repeat protein